MFFEYIGGDFSNVFDLMPAGSQLIVAGALTRLPVYVNAASLIF